MDIKIGIEVKVKVDGSEYTQRTDGTFDSDPEINQMCECALRISQNILQPLQQTALKDVEVYEYKKKYYKMTDRGLQPLSELEEHWVKNDLIRQQAERSRRHNPTETRENQATDNSLGLDSSQLGVNSENPPLDVEALRRKSEEIRLNRNKGVKGVSVPRVAGILNGDYNQPKAEVKYRSFFRLFFQKDNEVNGREVTFDNTPAALPATQVGNIIDAFSRLFFQKDKQEFHIAAANKDLHKYFPNISEDELQKLYKDMQMVKDNLRLNPKDGIIYDEDDFEVIADELWLETQIPVQVGDEKRSLLVQGKPDLILRNKKTGKFMIADFKSKYFNPSNPNGGRFGDSKYDNKTKAKYWYQLQLYKKAIEDLGGEVESTHIILTGVNYSRNFNESAYNYEGMYNSNGEFKPASSRSLFNSGGTHFYDDALNAATPEGDHPFDNAANRRDRKSGKKVHYKPVPVEVENSNIVNDINNNNGLGALVDSKTGEYVEVSLLSPLAYSDASLKAGQRNLNGDLLLTSESLTRSGITIPTNPYVKPKKPTEISDVTARQYLKEKGDIMQTKNVVELFRMALIYSRSNKDMTSMDGMYGILKTLITFNPDGKHVNDDLVAIIKRDKKFPDALNNALKSLHFSDDDIQTILKKVCALPEVGVTIESTENQSSGSKAEKYKNAIKKKLSLRIEGNVWTIDEVKFEFTGDGLRCDSSVDKTLINQLRGMKINVIVTDTQNNGSKPSIDMELSGPLRELADKGRGKTIDSGLMKIVIDYIQDQRKDNPDIFKWIDSTERGNIIKGLVSDIKSAKSGLNNSSILKKVKRKLECYQ